MKIPRLRSPQSRPRPDVTSDLAIVDSQFPQRNPLGFRNVEIVEYLRRVDNSTAYAMHPMRPGRDAWFRHSYGVSRRKFDSNHGEWQKLYPDLGHKVGQLDPRKSYRFGLAYSFFLAETYTLLPFYERHNAPFVFVLYPGGAFGIDNASSDLMLRRIFASEQFRSVIVTQELTRDYLLDRGLCDASSIRYIYGGFVQFDPTQVRSRSFFREHKQTFDICFVAAKYSNRGIDKGYDLFVEAAKRLSKYDPRFRFHVVGGFTPSDISVRELGPKIKFYGFRSPEFLAEFYSRMDVFLAPNRASKLYEGSFDGFPLGIDAAYCGVALFVSDPLSMNREYVVDKELVVIGEDVGETVERIIDYFHDPSALQALAHHGAEKTRELFDRERQVADRLRIFSEHIPLLPRST